jgi:hypothetical protein
MPRLFLETYIQKGYDEPQMRELVRVVEDAVNRLAEGRIYAHYNAATAAPTGDAVSYQVGDEVKNLTPTEAGTAGSMYLIVGWKCVAAGAPGTWREMRVLTGN